MKCAAIVCETVRDEYLDAVERTGCSYQTRWVPSGLHNYPEKLRGALQKELDDVDASRVLMCFGNCGNAVVGLQSRDYELILPRVDDCISLLLGSVRERMRINSEHPSYFLTAGWLRGERNIYVEYEHALVRFGEKRAKRIISAMLGNYDYVTLLDTGSFDITPAKSESEAIAEKLGLGFRVIPASVDYISKLLTGPHSCERFYVFPPNTVINICNL